jgi:hypothetical protein
MWTKTKVAFAAALILGAASAAMAGQDDRNDRGGFVIPGSMDGVNPVYHPGYFANASKAAHAANARKASAHARESYAQARPDVDARPSTQPTGAVRPYTSFERNWFDYQNHE